MAGQEAIANAKAEKIYRILDNNPRVFQLVNEKNVRSRMNICFGVGDPGNEKQFLEGSEQRSIQGIKGHRSVGGIRVSNYNAVHLDSIQRLADYLTEFAEGKRPIWVKSQHPSAVVADSTRFTITNIGDFPINLQDRYVGRMLY